VSLPPGIEEQLRRTFLSTELEQAEKVLRPLSSQRVLAAVVSLSNGNLRRLEHFARAAEADSRDVLLWAENPPDGEEPSGYKELRQRLHPPSEATE
jgi:hypothetical protein